MRKYWRQFFYCHKSEFSSYFIKKKRRGAAVKEECMAKNWKKRKLCRWMGLCLTVCILVISSLYTVCGAEPVIPVSVPVNTNIQAVCVHAPSAILMEASTGKILFEKEADEKRSPASVTKIMTLLLIFDVQYIHIRKCKK